MTNDNQQMTTNKLTHYAWLSLATAVATISLKVAAYWLTGSVGLLSDALESGVNLVTAVSTIIFLNIARQPPDEEHAYGHTKAEYLSSGGTGLLILGAAVAIVYSAVQRWLNPAPLEQLSWGLLISAVAAVVNFAVARVLLRAGRAHRSASLVGEGHHLMSDVWTSVGVLVGVALVWLTGWPWLDSLVALLAAAQISWAGLALVREAGQGLMDAALPAEELAQAVAVLERYTAEHGIYYHALRTRQAGANRFLSVHLQMPGAWSVQRGHTVAEEIETELRTAVPALSVFTHMEPLEDPRSWADMEL